MGRRRNRGCFPFFLVILAIIGGIVFYVVDNAPQPTTSLVSSGDTTPSANVTPTDADAMITPELVALEPTAEPENVTRLVVPGAGINQMIVTAFLDGTSWDVSRLGRNVGHLQGTAWFNQGSNVVLSGHVEMSDGRRGIFADLDRVQIGDVIIVDETGQTIQYRVSDIYTTTPDDLKPIYPTTTERLTLITCENYDFLRDQYNERLIIVADRVS